jgi:hypothetical protein
MDLMTLATLCIDDPSTQQHTQTIVQLASVAADQNPWYVLDETTQQIFKPSSLAQAQGIASALERAGHTLRIGLALVPAQRAREQGLTLELLFDPCMNLALAAEYFEQTSARKRPAHVSRQSWQLAAYLSPTAPEEALAFAEQVLLAPPPAGREFSLDTSSRVRIELVPSPTKTSTTQTSRASIHVQLTPARTTSAAPVKADEVQDTPPESSHPKASPDAPAKEADSVESEPALWPQAQATPAAPTSKAPRRPQPPVTSEKLPVSTSKAP